MFGRWAHLIFRRRRLVIGLWVVLLPFAVIGAANVGSVEGPGTFTIPGSQSDHVSSILIHQLHQNADTDILVVAHCHSGRMTSPRCRAELATLVGRIRSDALLRTHSVDNPIVTHHADLISRDRTSAGLLVTTPLSQGAAQNQIPQLRNLVKVSGLTTYVTGNPALNYDYATSSNQDLARSNLIALPILILVLVVVFGALAAAGMPAILALVSIPMSLSGVLIFAHFIDTSIYATNVVEVLGLGISIDYSLFIVYRFREEIRLNGGDAQAAIIRTMETTGRAVFFSGITVAIGLAALLLSGVVFMQSLGLAGILVPISALLAGMTLLPAVLSSLGTNVNRFRLIPTRMLEPGSRGPWHRFATAIMNRPAFFGGPIALLLLLAAFPTTHLGYSYGSIKNQPKNLQSIQGFLYMQSHFNSRPDPTIVTVEAPTGATVVSGLALNGLRTFQSGLQRLPGVLHIYGPASFVPSGRSPTASELAVMKGQYVANANRTAVLDVIGSASTGTSQAATLVSDARALAGRMQRGALSGYTIDVGGSEAGYYDWDNVVLGRFPFVVGLILVLTYCFLFFAFRSVFLPLKAVVLNLLSVLTAYGLMVLVFQGGVGSSFLGFSPEDGVATWVPIFLFAFLFGLSMDYEVLLLSRIREAWLATGNNRESVAFGLEKTGRLITSAALIMVIAFSSFVTGHQIQFKEFGFGLVISIAVDASLIRVILVPSIMELMGAWNWWVPKRLRNWAGGGNALAGVPPIASEPVSSPS